MNKKDKYIDGMLEKLGEYKPAAEPDWDAFYQANKGNILVNQSKGILSRPFIRLSVFFIAIAAVFIGGYYYMQPSSGSEEKIPSEESTIVPFNENKASMDSQTINPDSKTTEQQIEIIPQNTSPLDNANAGSIETIIVEPEIATEQTIIPGADPTAGQTIINEPATTATPLQNDSTADKPVIIKKTVIVKDTIHIGKPFKKDK